MKISPRTVWQQCNAMAAAFAMVIGALALRAQTAPAYAPPTSPATPAAPGPSSTLASMNEDIQSLIRQVGQLQLQVAALQQDNDNLRKQLITQTDVNTAVQNAASKSRDETKNAIDQAVTQANNDLRKEIISTVTKQIEALARDTNEQLQTLAAAIGKPPPVPHTVVATDPNKAPPPQDFGPGEVYVVKQGDNISKIAASKGVPLAEILKANNLTMADANKIRVGQQIFIPLKNAAPAPPAATK